jgi:hypothetical protein
MKESEWQAQVLDSARTTGWRIWRTAYSLYSTPGWPDLALVKPPLVLLTELKTRTGRVRPEQVEARDLLERCDRFEYHLWRPEHLPEVDAVLGVNARQGRLL